LKLKQELKVINFTWRAACLLSYHRCMLLQCFCSLKPNGAKINFEKYNYIINYVLEVLLHNLIECGSHFGWQVPLLLQRRQRT